MQSDREVVEILEGLDGEGVDEAVRDEGADVDGERLARRGLVA